jgi:ribosomal protein RSM22 (predicted rRNA methylase)
MTWAVPVELEDALYRAAAAEVGDAALATPALVRAIVDRSRRYTSDRERLAEPADPRGDLAARAVFFTIADAMKITIPLGELAGRGALPARDVLRVVDVGAGCGAMGLGLAAELRAAAQIVAIDRDAAALRIAASAMKAFADVTYETVVGDVANAKLPRADLVIAGTVLNELPEAARVPLVERMLGAIEDDGAVILIEPALRDTSRALHAVRDALLTSGAAHVFAPCTRAGAPCPALADPADWCHEDRPLSLPPRTAELARLTHLRDSGMKFSYLVLRRSPLPLVERAGAWRLVSDPMPAKGKLEIYGCSDAGRMPLRLLKRNRTDANRAFEKAARGDVIVTDATPGDSRVELDTAVDRIEPAAGYRLPATARGRGADE